jgi:hypothetical protein
MYFPTSNHYFEDSQNSQNFVNIVENNDCLICLEVNDNSYSICIRIHNQVYTKDCLCDGWVHEYCLDVWYVKNKKCPICLTLMNKNQLVESNETPVEIMTTTTNSNIMLFNRNNFCLAIKFTFSLIFLCYLFLMLSSIILKILENN